MPVEEGFRSTRTKPLCRYRNEMRTCRGARRPLSSLSSPGCKYWRGSHRWSHHAELVCLDLLRNLHCMGVLWNDYSSQRKAKKEKRQKEKRHKERKASFGIGPIHHAIAYPCRKIPTGSVWDLHQRATQSSFLDTLPDDLRCPPPKNHSHHNHYHNPSHQIPAPVTCFNQTLDNAKIFSLCIEN